MYSVFTLDSNFLDPPYDYDFTKLKDDGTVFMRGGKAYKRPYGWNRIALNVENKYGTTDWLGSHGYDGEWAVSYHGTTRESAEEIAKTHYDLSKAVRSAYGIGIYSSPDPAIAEAYATAFQYQGKRYKVILQNRVNMEGTRHIEMCNYLVTAEEKDIRPYAILYKEV